MTRWAEVETSNMVSTTLQALRQFVENAAENAGEVVTRGARRRCHKQAGARLWGLRPSDRFCRLRTGGQGPMQLSAGIVEAIGNTPLIALKHASQATGCTILGKAEFMNPGQSVKDRPARQMILEAERRGELKPGGLVVESTAGNTGIGLALVANARGYRTLIVIPETQSQEKKDMLRLCGAEVVEVPAVPYSNPNNYQHVGRRLAQELRAKEKNGVLFADQWNNLDNRKAHFFSTGPEIWQQTGGKVDAFICSVGTGGTLAGTSIYLREKNPRIVIGVADPKGAAMYNLFAHGEAKASDGGSIAEGIGLGRVTPMIEDIKVEKPYLIPDEEAVPLVFDLLKREGLCMGGSTGINVAGAIRLAKDLGPGHTIVTILADYGSRYQSKLFNPDFLRSKGLPVPEWLERKSNLKVPYV
jgi:cysteine synthase